MKYCPTCSNSYHDQVRYCFVDGTTLLTQNSDSDNQVLRSQEDKSYPVVPGSSVKTMSPIMYLVTGSLATALFAVLLVLAFRNSAAIHFDGSNKLVETPAVVSESPLPSAVASTTPAVPLDTEQMRQEILEILEDWRQAAERRDLPTYMAFYAPRIDYYKKSGASKEFVESDKKRFFDRNQTASITLSSIDIIFSSEGKSARILLDKEWIFNGNTRFSGKVRGQVGMRNIEGRWLIISEKDVRVYYVNK